MAWVRPEYKMNLREKLVEAGYHVSGTDFEIVVYLHGDFVARFSREDRTTTFAQSAVATNTDNRRRETVSFTYPHETGIIFNQ